MWWSGLRRFLGTLVDVPRERYPDLLAYWRARSMRTLYFLTSVGVLGAVPVLILLQRPAASLGAILGAPAIWKTLVCGGLSLLLHWLSARGTVGLRLAAGLLLPTVLVLILLSCVHGTGLFDPSTSAFFSVVVLSGLLTGRRGILLTALGSLLSILAVAVMTFQRQGQAILINPSTVVAWAVSLGLTVPFLAGVLVLWEHLHQKLHEESVGRELGRQEAELRAGQLKEAAEAKARLISLVVHELRSGLTAVRAYEQMARMRLQRTGADEAVLLQKADRGIIRLATLLNDLSDATRLESGRLLIKPRRCDLSALCREVVDAYETASERDIEMDLPEAPLPLQADPDRIQQVLGNLLDNALKYSQPGERVALRARTGEGAAVLEVRDEGLGIPLEEQERIFDCYYRLQGAAGALGKAAGLGLGLYICRQLVEQHKGLIRVQSAPGEGSTFQVVLPLGPE